MLNTKSYENKDAWCAYQIGEALANGEEPQKSVKWFEKAVDLAPYNLGFRSKLGSAYMSSGRAADAEKEIEFIIKEHPKNVSAYTNLGYIKLSLNKIDEAEELYNKGLKLDPDYEPLLLNVVGLKAYKKDYKGAMEVVNHILRKNPNNAKAKAIQAQLKSLS
jgi:Tfp pilus assembly protein PilF